MRRIMFLVLFCVSAFIVNGQNAWKKEKIIIKAPICYGSDVSHPSHIGPPLEYYKRLKSASIKKATIEVTYIGFPPEAQQAFQYAVDIWENLIYSPVPIRVQAVWESLDVNVLGSCGPANYYKNFNSTQKWNRYYPVALAEKMLGEEVNGVGQFDIYASFNKDFSNWYFGIDGKTPLNQYDFVSTVMHELTHGLGFTGLFYSSSRRGGYFYGSDALPGIFDQFVTDNNGIKLVKTSIYANPSTKLNQALTSNWLTFDTNPGAGKSPQLYAPSIWDEGSSIYHLDSDSYPTGTLNSLMTPSVAKGESIFDPGPHTLAIMYEMGWKSILIKHNPMKDIEYVSAPIDFIASIESDLELDSSKVFLVYSVNKFVKTDSVLLAATSIPANFSAKLSLFQNSEVRYFFSATDKNNRRFIFPANAPVRYLSFNIGIDNEHPEVTHQPVKYMIDNNLSVKIDAEVTDNLGIRSVNIEYFVNGGFKKGLPLVNTANDIYSGNLVFPAGSLKDGDEISYRIVAIDASSQSNSTKSPLSGYYPLSVQGIQKPVEKYVNNFNTQTNDFISSDFNVNTVTGFDSPALNSAHPYLSPDTDDMHFNFISILKYPIILKTGGKMSFDEIVLVEPGEPVATFGDEEFWDYVIVEGSKDEGNSWKPLINGYDSNAQKTWVDLFNSSMSGNNSIAKPTKDLFVKREFELLANGNFKAGDTIQIRFRLFSDPYSNGWGWIVDNLTIQDIRTDVNSLALSPGEVIFFPNPATDQLKMQFQTKNRVENLVIKAYNSLGQLIYNQQFSNGSNDFQTEIDVKNYIPGMYLFVVEPENGQAITRKIIIR